MHFHRVHIEVTNICGLACSFCPPKLLPSKIMPIPLFKTVLDQLQGKTRELAFHIMGDPFTLSSLGEYLDIAHASKFQVALTTSGHYLAITPESTLFHPAVKQINVSLNSFNKGGSKLSFDTYMDGVAALCTTKLQSYPKPFINLRVWNLDDQNSEADFNAKLFTKLSEVFDQELSPERLFETRPKSFRLASKVLLHFDRYFEWPTLSNPVESEGSCYGLTSHFGILADGRVVPCCLDAEGVITLGDVNNEPLSAILGSERSLSIRQGFAQGKACEELCRKCHYKLRF